MLDKMISNIPDQVKNLPYSRCLQETQMGVPDHLCPPHPAHTQVSVVVWEQPWSEGLFICIFPNGSPK